MPEAITIPASAGATEIALSEHTTSVTGGAGMLPQARLRGHPGGAHAPPPFEIAVRGIGLQEQDRMNDSRKYGALLAVDEASR